MESALAQPTRLIEYPSVLSRCYSLTVGDKQLLYLRSQTQKAQFVVVLGFYAGQREDIVTKDLIEPVHEADREAIVCKMAPECGRTRIFFL